MFVPIIFGTTSQKENPMNTRNLIKSLLLFLTLILIGAKSFAGTYPATVTYCQGTQCSTSASTWFGYWASVSSLCNSSSGCNCNSPAVSGDVLSPRIDYQRVCSGLTFPSWISVGGTASCPQGGTLSGSNPPTCIKTCTAPQELQPDGTCVAPNPCPTSSGQYGWFASPVGSTSLEGVAYCDNGCMVGLNAPSGANNPGYSYTNGKVRIQKYEIVKVGAACTSGPAMPTAAQAPNTPTEPPKKPVCAPSEGVLTSSTGAIHCVPSATPGATTPVVNKQATTTTNPDGTKVIEDTTTTRDPSTGVEDKQTTKTTKDANGNTTGVTSTSSSSGSTNGGNPDSPNNSDFCQKNPGLQICKGGMNEEATQKKVLEAAEKIRDRIGEVENLDEVKNATATASEKQAADDKHAEAVAKINDRSFNTPASADQASFRSELSSWFDPVPMTGCQALSSTIGNRVFTLDPCPTAARISEIFEYCLWFGLVVGSFAMVTRRAE